MKYCENGHSNRDDAKFCATCGKPIVQNTGFTLDRFPDIKLEVTDYSKSKKLGEISDILTLLYVVPLLLVILTISISFACDFDIPRTVAFICCLILGIVPSVVMSISMLKRYLQLKANSDFMENTESMYARIAKNMKLGLLEKCDGYIVRLPARYDLIEKINNECYSVQKNGKLGIYSTAMNKIIVPVKYENVSLLYEGVWSAVNNGTVTYYNHKGKVVK